MAETLNNLRPVSGGGTSGVATAVVGDQLTVSRWRGLEGWVIFALSLSLNLLAACLEAVRSGRYEPDAMGSTVQSWLLLSGDLFGFTAASSTLPPLPALLQAPLSLIPYFREEALSGNLLTALAGALICSLSNSTLAGLRLSRRWRWSLVALTALSPLFLHFSGIGSGAIVAACLAMLSVCLFLSWQRAFQAGRDSALASLISLGFVAGLAALTRYDSLAYAGLLGVLLWMQAVQAGSSRLGGKAALLITYCVPVVSILGIWLWFAVLVANDPSRINSEGLPAMLTGYRWLDSTSASFAPTSLFLSTSAAVAWLWGPLAFFAMGEVALLLDYLVTRHFPSLTLALLALSILGSHSLAILDGRQGWWIPGLVTVVTLGPILAGQVVSRSAQWGWSVRASLSIVAMVVAGLILSAGASATALAQVAMTGTVRTAAEGAFGEERQIASFITEHAGQGSVLLDDEEGYRIVFFARHPELFLMRGNPGYDQALREPRGRIDYLLARNPAIRSTRDQTRINGQYPALFDLGSDWTDLLGEWRGAGWRLYRVKAPA